MDALDLSPVKQADMPVNSSLPLVLRAVLVDFRWRDQVVAQRALRANTALISLPLHRANPQQSDTTCQVPPQRNSSHAKLVMGLMSKGWFLAPNAPLEA